MKKARRDAASQRREATMLKRNTSEMGVIFDEIEIEEVIAPRV